MRFVGLGVRREFCEVAMSEAGRVRSAGRIRTCRPELELFAESLGQDDEVALETTGGAAQIAAVLRPHVARVVVVNTKKLRAVSEAKAKTDRLDARRLAELLAAGYLGVWAANKALGAAEHELAQQAEIAYRRLLEDWQQAPRKGAGATPGRASSKPSSGKQRGKASVPDPAL